jgi:phosphoglycerol transferase MdoB-like AlkP superfamily enzyme
MSNLKEFFINYCAIVAIFILIAVLVFELAMLIYTLLYYPIIGLFCFIFIIPIVSYLTVVTWFKIMSKLGWAF